MTSEKSIQNGSSGAVRADPAGASEAGRVNHSVHAVRQREEFGGLNWGAAIFGWLVAVGIAAILTAFVSAAGAAIGLTNISSSEARNYAATIGIGGAVALLIVLLPAYYAGGYVAGRMSRFDGGWQGLGTWLIGVIITILFGAAGAIFGAKYNVLSALNLPRIPVHGGALDGRRDRAGGDRARDPDRGGPRRTDRTPVPPQGDRAALT